MVLHDPESYGTPIFVAVSATWLQQASILTEKKFPQMGFSAILWVLVLISVISTQGSKAGKKTGPNLSSRTKVLRGQAKKE